MDYQKLNALIREVENERYIDVGDIEYTYLQEELYAIRRKRERFPVFVRADSPEKALNKYNSFCDFDGFFWAFQKIIRQMLHALGWKPGKKFRAYRNYYSTVPSQSVWWEKCVEYDLAERIGDCKYKVSDFGIHFLKRVLMLEIEEGD